MKPDDSLETFIEQRAYVQGTALVTVSFTITDEQKSWIEQMGKVTGLSRSMILRMVIGYAREHAHTGSADLAKGGINGKNIR